MGKIDGIDSLLGATSMIGAKWGANFPNGWWNYNVQRSAKL
ncbi:MAG TPA: hypothetical protein VF773_04285 [Verrucomicrobiae bacterium]